MFSPELLELPQGQRILTVLRDRKQKGIYVWELSAPRPNGLGIAQYNARIKELRELGHDIVNTEPGHFVLKEFYSEPKIKKEHIEAKLRELRIEWRKYPEKRTAIQFKAMPLKSMLESMELQETVQQTVF